MTRTEKHRISDLSAALFDELITDEEFAELEALIMRDQACQEWYLHCLQQNTELSEVGSLLSDPAASTSTVRPMKKAGVSNGWFGRHPLASAAAGIVLGVLTTSVVWAYAVPKIPEVSRIEIPLVDPGFEDVTAPVPAVIPRALNRWQGDASHTVSSGDAAVKPKQGRLMMKMQPVEDRRFSRIEQVVDVRHLVPAAGGAVEFSASMFCDGAANQSKMILVLRAFTMSSGEINGSTEKLDDQVTSEARKTIFIPPGSTDWHTGRLRMDLPENTKTLVFEVAAIDLPKASKAASRYIDNINAMIIVSETAQESL